MIKQVKEADKTMSRAAKGHEKYGKEGMQALAKAGKEGKSLDPIRKKYDKYSEEVKEGSDWETTHDQFTTVGNRATPEQINKITSALDGVAEHKGVKHKYQMTHSDGSKMKFTAKDDADARRQAKEHDAKSVSKFKGGAYTDKVAEGGVGGGVRQWANQVRKDHGADVKFRNRQEGSGAVDSIIAKNSQGDTVGVFNRKTNYPTVFEPKTGVAKGSFGSGYGRVFTLYVNTGEKPPTKTKTKKFKREDDAVAWAEDYADTHDQYPTLQMEIKDDNGGVVWELEESQGVAEGSFGSGFNGPFTAVVNTGERPKSRTKTKKFRREDDAILWSEDWLEDFPQYVYATIEVKDSTDNVVWQSNDEQGVVGGRNTNNPVDDMVEDYLDWLGARHMLTKRREEEKAQIMSDLKSGYLHPDDIDYAMSSGQGMAEGDQSDSARNRRAKEAHEQNLDAAHKELRQRDAEGEDMSQYRVNPRTYKIEKKAVADKKKKTVKEGLGDLASAAERDHEVQMARADLYKLAKYAIKLHDMLKTVSEAEGIEGWQQAKITKAADYISSVYHALDYDMKFAESNSTANVLTRAKDVVESNYTAKLAERVYKTLKKRTNVTCSECGNPSYTTLDEEKQKGVDGKVCWKGYKRMGTKQKDGKTVDNCVKM
jgi:hypothetical protein